MRFTIIVAALCVAGAAHAEQKGSSNEGLLGKEKDAFLTSTKQGCEAKQRASPLRERLNISEAKIVAYCDCWASGMSEAITIDELRSYVATGNMPTAVSDKAAILGNFCENEVLGQK
jgi:hypothetical protein